MARDELTAWLTAADITSDFSRCKNTERCSGTVEWANQGANQGANRRRCAMAKLRGGQ
jgi:hypothetical protein